MSTIRTLVCDRCGAHAGNSSLPANLYVTLTANGANGRSTLPGGKIADLCGKCADSLQAWFANPLQFRQLHDLAEATLLFHKGAWTADDMHHWHELVGQEFDPHTQGLCDAIRKALAHPEEDAS